MFRSISERFGVKPKPAAAPAARKKSAVRRVNSKSGKGTLHLKVDIILLLTTITLMVFGLIMVYSSSYDFSKLQFENSSQIFNRQLLVLFIGSATMIVLAFMDYHILRKLALPALIVTIVSLLAVQVIGDERHGAARSLFNGSIQPSELAKLIIIIYLAVWLFSKRESLNKVTFGLIPLAIILGVMVGLILMQPDLSAVFTIIFLGGFMFFIAGGELRQIGVVLIIGTLVSWGVLLLYPTGAERIQEFFIGLKDPTQGSYHVQRAFEAFINGGWLGVGIGNSETKYTGLPVPHTDSIYAVVGEETGMFGSIGLLILFSLVLWRGLSIARRAPDEMGALLAAGVSIWIAFEAFINMAGIVNVMPFPGNAMPFISAGGSSLFVTLAGIGIVLNVSRFCVLNEEENGKLFGAVVNLRRRDGRRRVSGARRSAGAKVNR
jgi:cell division protein FtsW